MRIRIVLLLTFIVFLSCNGRKQNSIITEESTNLRVGGDCEVGYCELMYLGIPKKINPIDTSAGWSEKGQKLLVTGTVFKNDGFTPAPNVIVYYHHTDADGYYSPRNDKPENQTRHGHIRGWVKTDSNGKYAIYTLRPAPYPNELFPAHIHWLVKEPEIANEYWIDDLVFEDDPLLISFRKQNPYGDRGGSGVAKVTQQGNVQHVKRDIFLGHNIPNYPESGN